MVPFALATDECQAEKIVTSSFVVPSVLALHRDLIESEKTVVYLKSLTTALKAALKTRFSGIFSNFSPAMVQPACDLPFGDTLYLAAAVLDPSFRVAFIDHDVLGLDNNAKEDMKI